MGGHADDGFKAAVAGAGIANWQSYTVRTGSIPDAAVFGASVYDKPEALSLSRSPHHQESEDATLVARRPRFGSADARHEFWHALKALDVPTELVIYPEEGHAIAKPEHQRDIQERLLVVRSLGCAECAPSRSEGPPR
jgi:hypothetical protein